MDLGDEPHRKGDPASVGTDRPWSVDLVRLASRRVWHLIRVVVHRTVPVLEHWVPVQGPWFIDGFSDECKVAQECESGRTRKSVRGVVGGGRASWCMVREGGEGGVRVRVGWD